MRTLAAIVAAAALGRAFFAIGLMFTQPLLKDGPENAQRDQAEQ